MHSTGDDKEALVEAKKLFDSNFEDTNIRFAVSGIFIDSGAVMEDIEIVNKGITIFQELLEDSNFSSSEEAVITSKYNISNGFYTRFQLFKKTRKD